MGQPGAGRGGVGEGATQCGPLGGWGAPPGLEIHGVSNSHSQKEPAVGDAEAAVAAESESEVAAAPGAVEPGAVAVPGAVGPAAAGEVAAVAPPRRPLLRRPAAAAHEELVLGPEPSTHSTPTPHPPPTHSPPPPTTSSHPRHTPLHPVRQSEEEKVRTVPDGWGCGCKKCRKILSGCAQCRKWAGIGRRGYCFGPIGSSGLAAVLHPL